MGNENERSLAKIRDGSNLYLPSLSSEHKRLEPAPLGLVLARVVKDLQALPLLRSDNDLPEEIRYLRNARDGVLIMVSRRRPTSIAYRGSEVILPAAHTYGYFAEAFHEENGLPEQTIHSIDTIWSGMYEQVDISDEGSYRDTGLTPTNFDATRRNILGIPLTATPAALAEGESRGDAEEEKLSERGRLNETSSLLVPGEEAVIAKLFTVANAQASEMQKTGERIKSAVKGLFTPSSQGLSDEVGLANLIVTAGDYSPVIPLSTKLGLEAHTIPFWRMTHNLGPYVRHVIRKGGKASEVFPLDEIDDIEYHFFHSLKAFKEQHGIYPLVLTIDTRTLGEVVRQQDLSSTKLQLLSNINDERRSYPLFAVIEIGSDIDEEQPALIKREETGRYIFQGDDINDMQGLLTKIGVDYALTKQVRGLSSLVPSFEN